MEQQNLVFHTHLFESQKQSEAQLLFESQDEKVVGNAKTLIYR